LSGSPSTKSTRTPTTTSCRSTPETHDRQLERLERVQDERDDAAVEATLESVSEAIESDENVRPPIIEAVKACATMGETMAVFEEHHGAHQETVGMA
jgi:methylmalonyl-CoA mutase N-terminal domain/subunit